MIKKSERFTTKNFEFLRRKMKSFSQPPFVFFFGDGREKTRLSIVVRKKTEKSAVKRNRLKRQLYEFFRTEGKSIMPGKNIICLYNADKIPKNTAEILASIRFFFKKISGTKREKKTKFLNQKSTQISGAKHLNKFTHYGSKK